MFPDTTMSERPRAKSSRHLEALEKLKSENYEREDWSVDHATLWIAYGDPTLLHFVGLASPAPKDHSQKLSAWIPAKAYAATGPYEWQATRH